MRCGAVVLDQTHASGAMAAGTPLGAPPSVQTKLQQKAEEVGSLVATVVTASCDVRSQRQDPYRNVPHRELCVMCTQLKRRTCRRAHEVGRASFQRGTHERDVGRC